MGNVKAVKASSLGTIQPVEQLVVVEVVACGMALLSPPVDEPDETAARPNQTHRRLSV